MAVSTPAGVSDSGNKGASDGTWQCPTTFSMWHVTAAAPISYWFLYGTEKEGPCQIEIVSVSDVPSLLGYHDIHKFLNIMCHNNLEKMYCHRAWRTMIYISCFLVILLTYLVLFPTFGRHLLFWSSRFKNGCMGPVFHIYPCSRDRLMYVSWVLSLLPFS